jgi:hypothetical protein
MSVIILIVSKLRKSQNVSLIEVQFAFIDMANVNQFFFLILLYGTLVNVESLIDERLIIQYCETKNVRVGTIFSCQNKKGLCKSDIVELAKELQFVTRFLSNLLEQIQKL